MRRFASVELGKDALVVSFLDLTTIICSQAGRITTLERLIARNGILIVEFANTPRARRSATASAPSYSLTAAVEVIHCQLFFRRTPSSV
jgi:hypothetical protein